MLSSTFCLRYQRLDPHFQSSTDTNPLQRTTCFPAETLFDYMGGYWQHRTLRMTSIPKRIKSNKGKRQMDLDFENLTGDKYRRVEVNDVLLTLRRRESIHILPFFLSFPTSRTCRPQLLQATPYNAFRSSEKV